MTDIDIYSLKVGNVLELEPLFGLMDKENIVLQVTEKHRTSVVFEASYFGVALGTATYDAAGGWTWTLQ